MDNKVIASGTEEIEEGLLGSLDAEELEAGEYEVRLTVSDARGNQVEASASFEYIIDKKEVTVTVTQVINPEPVVPPVPSPSSKPEPTETPVIQETEKPHPTPAPTNLPDVGREELDDILNRTFGLTLSQDIAYTGTDRHHGLRV